MFEKIETYLHVHTQPIKTSVTDATFLVGADKSKITRSIAYANINVLDRVLLDFMDGTASKYGFMASESYVNLATRSIRQKLDQIILFEMEWDCH